MNDKDKKKSKKDYAPNDTETSGQNPQWPGQGLRKAGEDYAGPQDGDETIIPEVR